MFNECTLVGYLGKDPVLRQTHTTGMSVCNFTLSTSETVNKQQQTTWHDIVAWDKTAGFCAQYLKKGSKVLIKGRITYKEIEKKDGYKGKSAEIVAQAVKFLDSKKDNEIQHQQTTAPVESIQDDEIPFPDVPF